MGNGMVTEMANSALPQGSVIGILGGGQLGRMTSMDAARLGYRSHIYSPSPDVPAADVSARETIAEFDDREAVAAFARAVDVVTVETEHIPLETLRQVETLVPMYPSASVVEVCQHRVLEKQFINDAGVPTTRWQSVEDPTALALIAPEFGLPCIVKTVMGGYDGHGQRRLVTSEDCNRAAADFAGQPVILEEIVNFDFEASVIVARNARDETETYVTVRNDHRDHILWQTHAPANFSPIVDRACRDAATRVARQLDVVGLLSVEFFIGDSDTIMINELAPRPHNSGHWSMDGAQTPQFEQLVRAISGLPLGSTEVLHPIRMTNLLGDEVHDLVTWCSNPHARIHLYGKHDARKGRKMGHVNEIFARDKR